MKPVNETVLDRLQNLLPDIVFERGDGFSWSPQHSTVTYRHTFSEDLTSIWALFHEAGHAALGHKNYCDDIDLLQKEVAAWDKAKKLARKLDQTVDEDHVQDALDTYRDWLHQRSTCPRCGTVSLQISSSDYQCHNCYAMWQVSASRHCRSYRQTKTTCSGLQVV